MKEPFEQLHKGYLLKCAPQPTPDERHRANLVVSFDNGGAHYEMIKTPDHPSFKTSSEAAEYSLAEGKRWVEANG